MTIRKGKQYFLGYITVVNVNEKFVIMSVPNQSSSLGNAEDDELTLPRASINKMIKELVPSVRIANEARELVLNCCTEFIHLLSSEANDICNQLHKKTINAEHVLMGKSTIFYYCNFIIVVFVKL